MLASRPMNKAKCSKYSRLEIDQRTGFENYYLTRELEVTMLKFLKAAWRASISWHVFRLKQTFKLELLSQLDGQFKEIRTGLTTFGWIIEIKVSSSFFNKDF